MNIKDLLYKNNPKSFNEWKSMFSKKFLSHLKTWMNKENISYKLIPNNYEVLFYWSFINFRREQQLIKLLSDNFKVIVSDLKLDSIFKVDLIAINISTNLKYYLQLKNQPKNLDNKESKTLIKFANDHNAIPVLVFKKQNKFTFINLKTSKEIFLIS
ncbi:excisionase [Mycoplasmopsis adleri]|uniref:excisionase n=1 Tax=Mycoplasmopsis adleri TaxID=51362 RepID=UPI003872E999